MYSCLQALSAVQHSLERSPVGEAGLADASSALHTDSGAESLTEDGSDRNDTSSSLTRSSGTSTIPRITVGQVAGFECTGNSTTAVVDSDTHSNTASTDTDTNLADTNTDPADTISSLTGGGDISVNTVEDTSIGGEECPPAQPPLSLHPPPSTSHHPPPPTSTAAEITDYLDHLPEMNLPWQPLRSVTRCSCGRVFTYLASKVSLAQPFDKVQLL